MRSVTFDRSADGAARPTSSRQPWADDLDCCQPDVDPRRRQYWHRGGIPAFSYKVGARPGPPPSLSAAALPGKRSVSLAFSRDGGSCAAEPKAADFCEWHQELTSWSTHRPTSTGPSSRPIAPAVSSCQQCSPSFAITTAAGMPPGLLGFTERSRAPLCTRRAPSPRPYQTTSECRWRFGVTTL